jgi:hypothetical protein
VVTRAAELRAGAEPQRDDGWDALLALTFLRAGEATARG